MAYHADRLTRRPIELEHFLEVVGRAGVRHVRFVAGGDVDVAGGDGMLVLRVLGGGGGERVSVQEPPGPPQDGRGGRLGDAPRRSNAPFGYEDDRITAPSR